MNNKNTKLIDLTHVHGNKMPAYPAKFKAEAAPVRGIAEIMR